MSDLFSVNSRVKLKDGVSPEFYGGFARTGNEGVVRAQKVDEYGYPHIFVEWDKNHWAYNGAPDLWTWQDHFELIGKEKDMADDKESQLAKLFSEFIEKAESIKNDSDKTKEVSKSDSSTREFSDIIEQAGEALFDLDAFYLIGVEKVDGKVQPKIYAASKDVESSLYAQLQIANVAAAIQEKVISELIVYEQDFREK